MFGDLCRRGDNNNQMVEAGSVTVVAIEKRKKAFYCHTKMSSSPWCVFPAAPLLWRRNESCFERQHAPFSGDRAEVEHVGEEDLFER